MSNTVINDLNSSTHDTECNTALATDPYTALKAHFGMLLGVADFQTIDAYHRGKQWLHSAWLHREGVVWGFGVSIDVDSDEIRVAPGLAIDALGRELHLSQAICLNLPAWLEKHREDPGVIDALQVDDGQLMLTAHVVIQFKACLGRQVPALMEPCDGGGAATAYSRILETVEVKLKPGPAPQVGEPGRERPYHRLRLLFNLTDAIEEDGAIIAADQEVLDRRTDILSLDTIDQPKAYLQALREFAALEVVDLRPAQADTGEPVSNFPAVEPAQLVIADLIDLIITDNDLSSGEVDNRVRDSHIATATIQELLCGPLFNNLAAVVGEEPVVPDGEADAIAEDAGGPRIDRASVVLDGARLTMDQVGPKFLARSLVAGGSVSVMAYDVGSGWSELGIVSIECKKEDDDIDDRKTVTVTLDAEPDADLLRLIIKGTGLTPALATRSDSSRVPLAGELGGKSASSHDGNDFVHMINLEG